MELEKFNVNSPSEKKYPSWKVKFPTVYEILMGAAKMKKQNSVRTN
jgi:hypothetical protein